MSDSTLPHKHPIEKSADRVALDSAPPTVAPLSTTDSSEPLPVLMDVPEQIGRYRILRLLGRGGMGAVYLGRDDLLDRPIALKTPHVRNESDGYLERFYREARIAGRLQHPNICPVYEVGEADGFHYLSMAYIEGEPLSASAAGYAKRPAKESARLVHTLALALQEAHQQGVIHRDLKPANIIMNRRGEPVIMDFGLAREVQTASSLLTHQGAILGTPAYMAPEQARGDVSALGPGCDIYSLGIILYELLVGRVPFVGPIMDVLVQQVRDEPTRPAQLRRDLDPHLEAICSKALAKSPSERFLSMSDLAAALERYLDAPDSQAAVPLAEPCPLGRAVAEILLLLRTWGWDKGIQKIKQRALDEGEDCRIALLLRWLQGESGCDEALARLTGAMLIRPLAGWSGVGAAIGHNRNHAFRQADACLRETAALADPSDNILQASIRHQRGFWLYHAGKLNEALAALHDSLDLCGRDHYLTGRVLETLALVYANRNNFHTARDLFEQAIDCQERFGNEASTDRALRELGLLFLDWGFLDRAEETLQRSLQIALARQDEYGQACTFQNLGRLAVVRGERESNPRKRKQLLARAAEWLDGCMRMQNRIEKSGPRAGAHRDRAFLCLAEEDFDGAEQHAARAVQIHEETGQPDGMAYARQVQGIVARRRGRHEEAESLLRRALAHFDDAADYGVAARTQLEIARTLLASGALRPLIVSAFLDALRRAEGCRRTDLVRAAEEELKDVDHDTYWGHIVRRLRGRAATMDTDSLIDGSSEVATVVVVNLKGFLPFCQGKEPEEVMQTVNQMMADLGAVLDRHEAHILAHLGGGLIALTRGPTHARRAVEAACDLIGVADEVNRPRVVLGLAQLPVQVGVASGTVFLGNIGTYQKMDFTAVGNPVNLAVRLVRQADCLSPCISREVHEMVGNRFAFAPGNPRIIDLEGIGRREVWDVIGRQGMG